MTGENTLLYPAKEKHFAALEPKVTLRYTPVTRERFAALVPNENASPVPKEGTSLHSCPEEHFGMFVPTKSTSLTSNLLPRKPAPSFVTPLQVCAVTIPHVLHVSPDLAAILDWRQFKVASPTQICAREYTTSKQ